MALLWTVSPLATPQVVRWCRRCDERTAFSCSDKFRVNANQRRLDVWLVYRCDRCEASWNFAVHERVRPDDLEPDVHQDYLSNDRDRAWRCAFDLERLRRTGASVDADVPYDVAVRPVDGPTHEVRIELELPLEVRLDRLLAAQIGVSRSAVRRIVDLTPKVLRRPARHGFSFDLRS